MGNKMKALYAIVLKDQEQQTYQEKRNQDRLNENFKIIADVLIQLWESGDHTLNYLSDRLSEDEAVFVTAPDAAGIAAETIRHDAMILALPDSILHEVAETINGYTTQGETLTEVQQAVSALVEQRANEVNLRFASQTDTIGEQGTRLSKMESWVRVFGPGAVTAPGVIIGNSESASSFKAEAGAVYFYRGPDDMASLQNADVILDADGNLLAVRVRTSSMLLGDLFDVDIVPVEIGGTTKNFLHITGRGS